MPTYAALELEAVWRAQYVPPAMDQFLIEPLRAFYRKGPNDIGAPGDNQHLNGRHRSRDWDLTSRYCTNRSYSTTDARDKRGEGAWYRAVDIGITGQPLYDACHRLDAAVRAGQLPGVAEWFGTFDGKTVVGWSNGHPASSDDSHLTHLHCGAWTEFANDAALMRALYQTITGTAAPTSRRIDMPGLFKLANNDTLYMSDGFKRKALTGAMWADFKETWGDVPIATVADMAALDAIAGPDWQEAAVPPSGGASDASGTYKLTTEGTATFTKVG